MVSPYVIVLSGQAATSEQTAAREMPDYLQKVTGAKLPIRREEDVDESVPQIVVGVSDRMKQFLPDARFADPGPDGICMKTVGDKPVSRAPSIWGLGILDSESYHSAISELGHDGGYVVCSMHNLQNDAPTENIPAMYDLDARGY